jgi:cyclic beta-1,2-glucan synthetase
MAQAELARQTANAPERINTDIDARTRAADSVYRYFTYLSPAHRAAHPTRGPLYGLEPYVMAADVYSQPPYVGHGGWSWYTGAAAWMHRAAIESIFGLTQEAQTLVFEPCLPSHWPQAELKLTRDRQSMRFIFIRGTPAQALASTAQWQAQLLLPGSPLHWPDLPEQSCFVLPLPYVRQHTDRPAPPH